MCYTLSRKGSKSRIDYFLTSKMISSEIEKISIQIQIQITLFFPEIVHNNYMGIYKMNHRIT